jgi:hypothetical protein
MRFLLIIALTVSLVLLYWLYKFFFPKLVSTDKWLKGPNYIRKFTKEITKNAPAVVKRFNPKSQFVKQIVSSDGSEFFQILYKGEYQQLPIAQFDKREVIIEAISEQNEKILIYDGFVHGYDSLICGTYEWITPLFEPQKFIDSKKNEFFKIFICCNYNPQMLSELKEDTDEKGVVELKNKNHVKKLHYTRAFFEGFDSITIWVVSKDGFITELVDKECA